jgi:hypothetical protein
MSMMSVIWFVAGCLLTLAVGGGVVVVRRMGREAASAGALARESEQTDRPRYVVILQDPLPTGTLFAYPDEEAEAVAAYRRQVWEAYRYSSDRLPRYFIGHADVERELRIIAEVQAAMALHAGDKDAPVTGQDTSVQ